MVLVADEFDDGWMRGLRLQDLEVHEPVLSYRDDQYFMTFFFFFFFNNRLDFFLLILWQKTFLPFTK